MALTRHKSRGVDTASIPVVCEVWRERPVTRLVVNFIFACDRCVKRISTALWHWTCGAHPYGREFLL